MRKTIAVLLAVLIGGSGIASSQALTRVNYPLAADYDLDATSYTYLYSTGLSLSITNAGRLETRQITTSGSSTTVTSLGSTGSFDFVAVGDLLQIVVNGVEYWRKVTARASANSITVNDAITIAAAGATGVPFRYRTPAVGTGDVGWVQVLGAPVKFWWNIEQISVTGGIDVKIECRDPGAGNPVTKVYPDASDASSSNECRKGNFTAANACAVEIGGGPSYAVGWHECRLGMKIGSADDGTDTGGDLEIISAGVVVVQ